MRSRVEHREVARAVGLVGQFLDDRRAAGRARGLRPDLFPAIRAALAGPPLEQRAEHREPPVPGPLHRDLFAQFRREPAEHLRRRHVHVRQLPGGQPGQAAG